jgi:CubicO group peptidase (beta-lactamase class C family)
MKTRIFLFVAFALSIETGFGQQLARLDSLVVKKMNELHLAGAAICAIDSGKIKWTKYFGYQNIEKKIPVSGTTLFQIASVSKTVTASAIGQLVSQQKIDLDKDINLYLPFKVRNPHFPEVPITAGELLRHRSSIIDNYTYYKPLWAPNQGDHKISLNSYLRDYLVPGGVHYNQAENFMKLKPHEPDYTKKGASLNELLNVVYKNVR